MKTYVLFSYLFCLMIQSCASTERKFYQHESRKRQTFEATGENAMVATAHPLASRAALKVLKRGGNAIDAAICASFVLAVVRPQSTGIGGGGFLLYHQPSTQKTTVLDFREEAPRKSYANMYVSADGKAIPFLYKDQTLANASLNGHLSAGVPGLVAGLVKSHQRFGKLKFKDLVQPAIDLARDGFKVYPSLARAIEKRKNVLMTFSESRKIFLPRNKPLQTGDTLKQKDLAKSLQLIAENGQKVFYHGSIASAIVSEFKEYGIMEKEDLSSYKVKERSAITSSYKGYKIKSMPPPSSGGIHIAQILNILENDDLHSSGHNSFQSIHLIVEAMRRAYYDRSKYLGDPEFTSVPRTGLLSKKYARSLRNSFHSSRATPSTSLGKLSPLNYESESTTHISIVDQWGQAVSSTQTINYLFGSGVVVKGTGILMNNEMDDFSISPGKPNVYGLIGGAANAIAPKKRMLSSMSPTMVFDSENRLLLVTGSPGGSRIITAIVQMILNIIEYKMTLRDAVHSFRFHHQYMPDTIFYEKDSLQSSTIKKLQTLGYDTKISTRYLGDIQAIQRDFKNQLWLGVSDTRSDGKALGF